MTQLPILQQRQIEANILKHVFETLRERLGQEQARNVIRDTVSKAAIQQGRDFAADVDGEPDLKDFHDILPNWTRDGALEIELLEASTDTLNFKDFQARIRYYVLCHP